MIEGWDDLELHSFIGGGYPEPAGRIRKAGGRAGPGPGYWRKTIEGPVWVEGPAPYSSALTNPAKAPKPVSEGQFNLKTALTYLTYSWSGWSTAQTIGTVLEGGIPGVHEAVWEGLGQTKYTAIIELGMGGYGALASFDYMGGENRDVNESAWWGGFGSALFKRGLNLWDTSPTIGEEITDAAVDLGESILDYPVFGGKGSDALIEVGLTPEAQSAWDWLSETMGPDPDFLWDEIIPVGAP